MTRTASSSSTTNARYGPRSGTSGALSSSAMSAGPLGCVPIHSSAKGLDTSPTGTGSHFFPATNVSKLLPLLLQLRWRHRLPKRTLPEIRNMNHRL